MDTQKTKVGQLDANVAATICYLPLMSINFFSSIVFLVTEPKESKLVRFHAIQSLLLLASIVVVSMMLGVCAGVAPIALAAIDEDLALVGSLIAVGIVGLTSLGFLAAMILCMVQAYKGSLFRIPLIGQLADKLSG